MFISILKSTSYGSGSNVPNGTFAQIYLITIQYIDQMAFNMHKISKKNKFQIFLYANILSRRTFKARMPYK